MSIRFYVRVSSLEQKVDRQLISYDKADFTYIDNLIVCLMNCKMVMW